LGCYCQGLPVVLLAPYTVAGRLAMETLCN
jgi:hypothetical protein